MYLKPYLHDIFWQTCFKADDKTYRVNWENIRHMLTDEIELVLFALSDTYNYVFEESDIRSWGYSINSTSVHVQFSRDFCNLLNINNTDKENNMSLMGFRFLWKSWPLSWGFCTERERKSWGWRHQRPTNSYLLNKMLLLPAYMQV